MEIDERDEEAGVRGEERGGATGSPADRRKRRSSPRHSAGLARVDLGEVSVLVRRREVVQRMEGILRLKVVDKRARNGGRGGVSVTEIGRAHV